MEIKHFYKVGLMARDDWKREFIDDCKKNNCIFPVLSVNTHAETVKLKRPTIFEDFWDHPIKYGDFCEPPVDESFKGMFEL